jgi:phosphate:Na+ symporter
MSIVLALTEVLGGLALFLFGLNQLSSGLKALAGERLRAILEYTTRNRVYGYFLGCSLGFLLHSSGTTVMLVSFVNAGLFSLLQAIPVVLGANVGTTLSMQAISLNLTALSYPAIALGMAGTFHRKERYQSAGRSLFGFGLLFLGMYIMKEGITPYREELRPFLETLDGSTWTGMIGGILLSVAITSVMQSSGATIGMCFSLIQADVFTSLTQVIPVILGAHIGTCATAFLASMGSPQPARRLAVTHLIFNLFNVTLAVILQGPLISLIEASSDNLTRQTANLHTLVMLVASLMVLPLIKGMSLLVHRLVPGGASESASSYLTPERMGHIESALPAARMEMIRLSRLALESTDYITQHLKQPSYDLKRKIRANEEIFNTIKSTLARQLRSLGYKEEVHFQDLRGLDQWIRCVVQMERIGDHMMKLHQLSDEQNNETDRIMFGKKLDKRLLRLFSETREMLDMLRLNLESSGNEVSEQDLNAKRQKILTKTKKSRDLFSVRMEQARMEPRVMYYYTGYLEIFERLIRHIELAGSSPVPHPAAKDPETDD